MKSMLLVLLTLASVALADDAKMKALLVGTWNVDQGRTYTFTSDGRWLITDEKFPDESAEDRTERWDIKDGQLIEIRPQPSADRPFTILFLTKHEFLAQSYGHGNGYIFWWR